MQCWGHVGSGAVSAADKVQYATLSAVRYTYGSKVKIRPDIVTYDWLAILPRIYHSDQ